jgi:hypothetical protein
VAHPTRIGNIIESFEAYPKVKYGLDSVFFWFRLWVVLDKDLREEIDTAQAVVDSTVYMTFALYLSGLVLLIYAIIGFAAQVDAPYLHWLSAVRLPYVPAPHVLLVLSAMCFIFGFLLYRLSLTSHAQFGELFKSIFDQYQSKLQFNDVVKEVGKIAGDPYLSFRPAREKNQIIWRFLRWHLIRDEAANRNLTVKQWQERQKAAADGTH